MNPLQSGMRLVSSLLVACTAGPAMASSPIAEILCAPKAEIQQRLSVQYQSSRRATGMRGPGEVIEIWTNDASGRWTMVATYASGTSCIVAMGEAWTERDPA